MKNKILLLFFLGFILISSCKKQNQGTITSILTAGNWQLASVLVTTTDSLNTITDTLNANCSLGQTFIFKTDKTCTYTNFSCIQQTASGQWSLSSDQLTLSSDIILKDNTATTGSSQPFANAQIFNAGQYSLVLQTGDYNIIPTTTNKTKVTRYGFIRQNAALK